MKDEFILAILCDDGPCLTYWNDGANLLNFLMDLEEQGCMNEMALAVAENGWG